MDKYFNDFKKISRLEKEITILKEENLELKKILKEVMVTVYKVTPEHFGNSE
ncbi:hypothetical protein SAMN05446037_100131 [Anaerovirgula multivorans]|uniref:Uncharacterized protein n=1 Tax=Anaerovirgula multivorans TaxID=312168 RepID=A0A238ZQP9_9FIRM|nr:hypothetical protein [Anaerovirgula multivorans]SNR85519.1 hypothetical protein SAMN05446037_100131 [Anaerovirgula multivorans]